MRITEQWVRPPAEHSAWGLFILQWYPGERIMDLNLLYCSVQVLLIERHYCLSKCRDTRTVQKVHSHGTRCIVCFLSELCTPCSYSNWKIWYICSLCSPQQLQKKKLINQFILSRECDILRYYLPWLLKTCVQKLHAFLNTSQIQSSLQVRLSKTEPPSLCVW